MNSDADQARLVVATGLTLERLISHPRLPLVAGLDSGRPAVHVWELGPGGLRQAATIGGDVEPYGDAMGWDRMERTPSVSWHPHEPALAVAGMGGVRQWTPAGVTAVGGVAGDAAYRYVAFSPDGRTVFASPAPGNNDDDGGWGCADAVDVASGALRTGLPYWDTGVATHPGGGLVLTLASDQGATHGLFARVDDERNPAVMRVLTRALMLDVDGYETPLFSRDGSHIAVRGNAYENTLQVFDFPSLRQVVALTLGSPSPGYPYPDEWLAEMESWSRHNIAFAYRPGAVLLVGTPAGTIIELDVETGRGSEYDALGGDRVTALAVTAAGNPLVAGAAGDLVLLGGLGSAPFHDGDTARARELVASFLDSAQELPDDADLDTDLVLTNGVSTWTEEDLEATTEASGSDPTWLQIRAFMNAARDKGTGGRSHRAHR